MKSWRDTLVKAQSTVRETLAAIDRGAMQIALVVEGEETLAGVVTDGDIRKHLVNDGSLNAPIGPLMNTDPLVASPDEPREDLLERMRERQIHQVPLVDGGRRVVGLVTVDDLLKAERQPYSVVLMAGGLGKRLRPLTEDTPKPMLKVGQKPILETIVLQLRDQGFRDFFISVNYLGQQVVEHFGDGSRLDVVIRYIREEKPMGTAGALSLLPERPSEPFLVMNADLLTKLNFSSLMAYHISSGAPLTICLREHALSMPFGVAHVSDNHVDKLVEKPTFRHLVNAGIYAADPQVIDLVSRNEQTSMVDLAQRLIGRNQRPAAFPIHEYWMDIGRHGDLLRATDEFDEVFE